MNKELDRLGIIFVDTDTAVKKYPELVKKYFGTVIPSTDNKFHAQHGDLVWWIIHLHTKRGQGNDAA